MFFIGLQVFFFLITSWCESTSLGVKGTSLGEKGIAGVLNKTDDCSLSLMGKEGLKPGGNDCCSRHTIGSFSTHSVN